jgi:hypothetical protein
LCRRSYADWLQHRVGVDDVDGVPWCGCRAGPTVQGSSLCERFGLDVGEMDCVGWRAAMVSSAGHRANLEVMAVTLVEVNRL